MIKTIRISFFILFFLAGCTSFHLRGTAELPTPLKKLYLKTSQPYSPLSNAFKEYCQYSKIPLVKNEKDATAILVILNENTAQQLVAISNTQQTRQYNLSLAVSFQVISPEGNVLVPDATVSETRAVTLNASQLLSGSNQEEDLYEKMRQAIVVDVVRQLTSTDTFKQLNQLERDST